MATTNMQQWNPTAANQETDAEYTADSQRVGGATNPSLFDAKLANKLFFQLSTYLDALFTAFAVKGFTTSDSNLSTLTAQCANFLTTADVRNNVRVVAYAPALTLDGSVYNGIYVSGMTGALSLTISNLTSGQLIALYFQQDGAGGRTVAYPGFVVGAAQPDPAANAVSGQLFYWDTTTGQLRALTPMMSNNLTVIETDLDVAGRTMLAELTLNNPGVGGQILTNVSGFFVPQDPPTISTASVTDVTGARVFGGVYQNTSGGELTVTGWGHTGGSSVASMEGRIGTTNPPTLSVWGLTTGATVNNGACAFSFKVPNGWYYGVYANTLTNGQGSAVNSVGKWVEMVTV